MLESLTGIYFPSKGHEDVLANKKRIVDRLGVIITRNLTLKTQWSSDAEVGREEKILDDITIYRCLLMTLLLWTAPDCGDLLLSGLWQQNIPII